MITHFHLDHWGDLVPWVWGALYLQRARRRAAAAAPLGAADGIAAARALRQPARLPRHVRARVRGRGVRAGRAVRRRRPRGDGDARPALPVDAYALPRHRRRAGRLPTRATPGPGRSSSRPPGTPISSSARRRCSTATSTAEPRGHLSLEEAEAAFAESGAARLLLTHRPAELPIPPGRELAYDGLSIEI